jgi:hypothetical protein
LTGLQSQDLRWSVDAATIGGRRIKQCGRPVIRICRAKLRNLPDAPHPPNKLEGHSAWHSPLNGAALATHAIAAQHVSISLSG